MRYLAKQDFGLVSVIPPGVMDALICATVYVMNRYGHEEYRVTWQDSVPPRECVFQLCLRASIGRTQSSKEMRSLRYMAISSPGHIVLDNRKRG